jgi:GNAT superfamily N-acetyltransferase
MISEPMDDEAVAECWEVVRQLRPHVGLEEFVERVARQRGSGYRLVAVIGGREDAVAQAPGPEEGPGPRVVAVAGFRVGENLAWGKFMYVDDLVTDEACRSCGHGQRLFAWLVEEARRQGCEQFHLDSGVQRFGAHRFYLRSGMDITSHHFAMKL